MADKDEIEEACFDSHGRGMELLEKGKQDAHSYKAMSDNMFKAGPFVLNFLLELADTKLVEYIYKTSFLNKMYANYIFQSCV